jgi:transposase IS4-like protein
MSFIGKSLQVLEHSVASFTLEVVATVLNPKWITEAASHATRPTERERDLPGPFVTWLVIAMGLFRSVCIQNVLRRLGNALGSDSLWEGEVPRTVHQRRPGQSRDHVQGKSEIGFRPIRPAVGCSMGSLRHTHFPVNADDPSRRSPESSTSSDQPRASENQAWRVHPPLEVDEVLPIGSSRVVTGHARTGDSFENE